MPRTVRVGEYQGWAVVAGYKADVVLSASRVLVNDGRGGAIPASLEWSGTAIILDLRARRDLLELGSTVEVTIDDRASRATVSDVNPGTLSLQLDGAGDPPFDTADPSMSGQGQVVGHYDGPASIDSHDVDAQLDAVRDHAGLRWRGAVFFTDPHIDFLTLSSPVEIVVTGHRAEAKVIYASPDLGYLYLHGIAEPPFDIEDA